MLGEFELKLTRLSLGTVPHKKQPLLRPDYKTAGVVTKDVRIRNWPLNSLREWKFIFVLRYKNIETPRRGYRALLRTGGSGLCPATRGLPAKAEHGSSPGLHTPAALGTRGIVTSTIAPFINNTFRESF